MIVKQLYNKKKTVFQNTKETVETEQNQSNEMSDIKLDSEYVTNTDEIESKGEKSADSKEDSDEK